MPMPYERTIRDYLGIRKEASILARPYIAEQTYGLAQLQRGTVIGVQLSEQYEVPGLRPTNPSGIEFRHYFKSGVGVAVDLTCDKPVGFISGNLAVSIRQGLGVGSHLAAYFDGPYISFPRSFSASGLRNRLAAHALLVTWALLDGESVPQEVRDEYCCISGRLESREKLVELGRMPDFFHPAEHILVEYDTN